MIRSAEHMQWDAALAAGRARADREAFYAVIAAFAVDFERVMRKAARALSVTTADFNRSMQSTGAAAGLLRARNVMADLERLRTASRRRVRAR